MLVSCDQNLKFWQAPLFPICLLQCFDGKAYCFWHLKLKSTLAPPPVFPPSWSWIPSDNHQWIFNNFSSPPAIEILNITLIVDISSSILNVSLQFNCLLFSSSLKIVGPEQKKTQLFASHVFMAICVFNMHTPCRRGKKTLVHIPWRQDITFFLFL